MYFHTTVMSVVSLEVQATCIPAAAQLLEMILPNSFHYYFLGVWTLRSGMLVSPETKAAMMKLNFVQLAGKMLMNL
jgi:hypothetical protein